MHSFVRVLEERCDHNQSELAKNFYSEFESIIAVLTKALFGISHSGKTMSDSKQHWVSWPNFIFSFILF